MKKKTRKLVVTLEIATDVDLKKLKRIRRVVFNTRPSDDERPVEEWPQFDVVQSTAMVVQPL